MLRGCSVTLTGFLQADTTQCPLLVPSGSESGLCQERLKKDLRNSHLSSPSAEVMLPAAFHAEQVTALRGSLPSKQPLSLVLSGREDSAGTYMWCLPPLWLSEPCMSMFLSRRSCAYFSQERCNRGLATQVRTFLARARKPPWQQ